MPGFDRQLARYPHLYSRIGFAHQYQPLDPDDPDRAGPVLDQLGLPFNPDNTRSGSGAAARLCGVSSRRKTTLAAPRQGADQDAKTRRKWQATSAWSRTPSCGYCVSGNRWWRFIVLPVLNVTFMAKILCPPGERRPVMFPAPEAPPGRGAAGIDSDYAIGYPSPGWLRTMTVCRHGP
jgi:hypothetical protein